MTKRNGVQRSDCPVDDVEHSSVTRLKRGMCNRHYMRWAKYGDPLALNYATGSSTGNWKDGRKNHPLYAVWRTMLARCQNPNNHAYQHYGARGIKVCDRWQGEQGFPNFLADMGPRPEGYYIDRIDNDGGYEPSNCRWADASTSTRNRSITVLTFDEAEEIRREHAAGIQQTIIAKSHGLHPTLVNQVVRNRIWVSP